VEHPAVERYLKHLEERGKSNSDSHNSTIDGSDYFYEVTYVPVDGEGRVSARDILGAVTDDTILVTLMTANNESGALQPVAEVARECRQRGVLFHTDAAQAAGKVPIRLDDLGHPDMVTIVGHKIGAPKGKLTETNPSSTAPMEFGFAPTGARLDVYVFLTELSRPFFSWF
jgi:cysteine sulfinate desulfinase/cysteine desulfurase-like protein